MNERLQIMQETAIEVIQETKPKKSRSVFTAKVDQGRVDLSQALILRLKHNLPFSEIGNRMGVTKQAVEKRLKSFLPLLQDPEALVEYETHEASLLTAANARLLVSLVDEKAIKEASLNNRAYAFNTVNNIKRLVLGQSTENINLLAVQGDLKAIREGRERLFRELQALKSVETSTDGGTIPNDTK